MRETVLVTGGAGYLGSILTEHLLNNNYKVIVVDSLRYEQNSLFHLCSNPNFSFIYADVRNVDTLKPLVQKADVIIPLAAIVGAPACDQDPHAAQSVNYEAVVQLNALRSAEQLLIYPNTNSGYGTKSSVVYCDENTPLEPISLYGVVKVKAENELLQSENSISLRLATVFGMSPRMRIDLLVNHFVYTAIHEKYIIIFEKDFKRNYIHIRDVANCFIYCIERRDTMKGQAYNVGFPDANLSKQDLAEMIKSYIPDFYVHYSDIGEDVDKRNYIVSSAKIMGKGFIPQFSLSHGINELIKGLSMIQHQCYSNV